MNKRKALLITSLFLHPIFSSAQQHQRNSKALSNTSSTEQLQNYKTPQIPLVSIEAQNPSRENIMARTLLFWEINNGNYPDPKLSQAAGLSPEKVQKFYSRIQAKNAYLDDQQKSVLRAPYQSKKLKNRMNAREKLISNVSEFQKEFPAYQGTLPEILTVWGESRNISGFTENDDSLQQAKMASVIHVLRNRTNRKVKIQEKYQGTSEENYIVKWKEATRRYQFSAFEPYDPNLAELSLGPTAKAEKAESQVPQNYLDTVLAQLPDADRRSLSNLSEVIVKFNRGDILLHKPLGNANIRHYLTPTLMAYSKSREKILKSRLSRRSSLIRIPNAKNPSFLAIVPHWAVQSSLIADPPVDVLQDKNNLFATVAIPTKDFVYFEGIL